MLTDDELLNRIVREDFSDEPEEDPYEETGNPVGELPIGDDLHLYTEGHL
jgi:hypothetical protein